METLNVCTMERSDAVLPQQNKEGFIALPQQYTAASGELCPCSGEWEIIGLVTTTAVFSKGQRMPDYYGKPVIWRLVRRE